jgi:Bacterial self-protective colicin-like immunity
MPTSNAETARYINRYKELISRFINGQISGEEFQTSYLPLFKTDKTPVPSKEFDILDGLFADTDDYTSDPELRERAGGLDDEELRTRAREAYRKLYET